MTIKRFSSLVQAVLNAVGFMAIEGYASRHVSPDDAERVVKSGKEGERKVSSCFPTVGVNSDYDGIYLRFPFDGATYDVANDRNHHTTCDVGSILKGVLHAGYSLIMVGRNAAGQFEKVAVEFDTLCPQLPEAMVPSYIEERGIFELRADELDKATKVAKDRGLIAKRAYTPSGDVFYRVEESRRTWKLTNLPKNGKFTWKGMANETLMARIAELTTLCKGLADSWRSVAGLGKIEKDSQVFRILDGGLVETGKVQAVVGMKVSASYVTPDQFDRMLARGEIELVSKGETKTGRKLVTA